MKVSEIHKTFKVMMDKNAEAVAFGGCPAFLPEEIDLFLNQAYVEVICNKYTGTNTLRVPFEGTVKRIQDLEGLVKTDKGIAIELDDLASNTLSVGELLTAVGDGKEANGKKMFFVSAVLHWEDADGETDNNRPDAATDNNRPDAATDNNRPDAATVTMIDHEVADRFLLIHNNSPWIPTPVAVIADNTLTVYVDPSITKKTFTIDITYVKYPEKMDVTTDNDITEVPDRVLYEVINRAVLIALENIESKRTETKINLNNLQE